MERRLEDLGDAAPSHERARAEMLVTDARQAVADQAPMDRVRELTSELQQVLAGLSAASAGAGGQAGGQVGADVGAGSGGGPDDDVIDAEFDRS
ncbi:MAG: Chaperone protein dnaK [Modestobacter sp.]|nr:Chaperone protein dnaK [Modestobacter sp.]